jgi:hypothetical protein
MTIPVYILGATSLIIQLYASNRYRKRAIFLIRSCVPVTVRYLLSVVLSNPAASYTGMFILVLGK